jgi:hypothetical protein
MLSNVITLVINLLSAIQWIEKDEELQRKILEIVRDQIDLALKPKKTIQDIRSVYENEGKIPAIKEWRTINDGMGLKDAKDAIEAAASKYDWRDYKIGKKCTIFSPNSSWDGRVGKVDQVVEGGFYVKFADFRDSVYFHQSAVRIDLS